ncbi:FAD-dependent oxidoreductase [Thermosyntropha sp.]|uniref:oxidoreductase n=1 Tax=Thermosyntropha sp. TaxID=2740820 RepID=UPI0025E6917A|nr:FAD-dependent oxidoreductase [Thermosyntropha sp.]MBO8159862.1 FAD-dependent oxidoreductase [Thermosyntropha sp.]
MELGRKLIIGKTYFKNRIVMPPMGTGLASVNGEVTEQMIKYYEKRAQGGAGAIIVEIACVDDPTGRASLTQLCIDKPRYIAGLKELSEVIKSYDCRAFIQLHHAGRQTNLAVTGGRKPVAPSPIPCKFMRTEPAELDREGIERIKRKFVTAAVYAAKAGFDGVELHAAHGYLLSQFLSPYTNKREDEYGGSLAGRTKIVSDIIKDIKRIVPELLVSVRFNIADFVPGGLEVEEGIEIAKVLEKAGADILNVSCGIYESGQTSIETASFSEGWRMKMVKKVKENTGVLVLGGGNIRDPHMADCFVKEGYADLIWVGRGMLADPFWAHKALRGQKENIRPCISCNTCINSINNGLHIRCAVNPQTGREARFEKNVKLNGIKVLVVGGGPAGMKTAVNLKQAGCQVILLEKEEKLGGRLNIASKPPHKDKINRLVCYLEQKILNAGVEVRFNTEYSESIKKEINPDVIIWAAGAEEFLPYIPGLNTIDYVSMEEVLSEKVTIKGEKVLIIGGGSSGCELADYLAEYDNEVIIVEKDKELARGLENMTRLELLLRLKRKKVKMVKNSEIEVIDGDKAVLKSGERIEGVSRVIFACGYKPGNIIENEVDELLKIYVIGDAKKPRDIASALYEADFLVYDLYSYVNKENWE